MADILPSRNRKPCYLFRSDPFASNVSLGSLMRAGTYDYVYGVARADFTHAFVAVGIGRLREVNDLILTSPQTVTPQVPQNLKLKPKVHIRLLWCYLGPRS